MLHLVKQALRVDGERSEGLPDFVPGEEIPAPFDLPRGSQSVKVIARPGGERLPDPFPDE